MATISDIQNRLIAIDLKQEIKTLLESTKSEVADLNRERMLNGRLADGSKMPNYSQISVIVYGYPPGPWRLKNTGSFQEKITIAVNDISIVSTSTDEKTAMLKRKMYAKGLDGEEIFGLDAESKKEYIESIRPLFKQRIRSAIKL